ncbi:MAG: four helix bundle protein [Endomicrobia bacterium]|nr:four helix bundle protein [Bacillota bacterium]MCL1971500.1 four helix bundle protein [Endomicrobiia bacterium]
MKENRLTELSMDFAVQIIELVKFLKKNKESIVSNQIGRSGTSIGANISEAQHAQSKSDFISKMEIALKESNETSYWLKLLNRSGLIDNSCYKTLDSLCTKIRILLIASCKTAKNKQ